MMQIRKSQERGAAKLDWLDSKHTFSFADYHDPNHMGFGPLRVINEDRIVASGGFPTHPHRDMEIISYVLEGQLAHKDNMGNGSIIRRGEIQKMSAGTGIQHSEFNPSGDQGNHFFQIWIIPDSQGLEPSYEQQDVPPVDTSGAMTCIGSKGGASGGVSIHQDVDLYVLRLDDGERETYSPATDRHIWVQVAWGTLNVNGETLSAGDAAALEGEASVLFEAGEDTEALVFDLA